MRHSALPLSFSGMLIDVPPVISSVTPAPHLHAPTVAPILLLVAQLCCVVFGSVVLLQKRREAKQEQQRMESRAAAKRPEAEAPSDSVSVSTQASLSYICFSVIFFVNNNYRN